MVEAIGVSDGQSVCGALVDFELAAGYEGGGPASGKFERGGGIAVALNNESGEGNGAQVGAKVGGGKHAVKLEQDLHGALQKHVGLLLHHLGGNRIFRRAEKGGVTTNGALTFCGETQPEAIALSISASQ